MRLARSGSRLRRCCAAALCAAWLAAAWGQPVRASTLEQIQRTGVLRIGYGNTLPFSYPDAAAEGGAAGYAIDLCRKVAEEIRRRLGMPRLELRYVATNASNRVRLLDGGAYDIECGASTGNAERRRSASFSIPHFFVAVRHVSLARHGLRTVDDLRGRSVSLVLGSVNIARAGQISRERRLDLSVITADTPQAAFDLVTRGRASAAIMDDAVLGALIASSADPGGYALSQEALAPTEPYGLMMRLDDHAFVEHVDAALRKIYAGADMQALYDRWFTQPIPGRGVNLRMPMSRELRQVIEASR